MVSLKSLRALFLLSLMGAVLLSNTGHGVEIFSENFDSLADILQPAVNESIDPAILGWTHTPPTGWTIDNDVPGIGDDNEGMEEWEGWSFTTLEFWTAADGQRREEFVKSSGVLAVADPDEWDDLGDPDAIGTFDSLMSTPSISLAGVAENTATLTFDSSWRPEDTQRRQLTVSYDGADPIVLLDEVSTTDDLTNQTIELALNNPGGASEMVLSFNMIESTNDWWWAVDNIQVDGVVPEPSSVALALFGILGLVGLRRRRA